MLVAAAVCPHPPLLVPEIGVGLGPAVEEIRRGCAQVVRTLAGSNPDRVYIVGAAIGPAARSFAPWAPGSGAEHVAVDLPEPLPLPLLVGAYLTRGTPRSFVVVDPSTDAGDCAELGRELSATDTRVALLVMGDGAARHDVKAPGYVDDRAPAWDQQVHDSFVGGDLAALEFLDPALGDELLCAGRAPWQVLGGAATGRSVHVEGASLHVPFGVGYHVAHWTMS